MKCYDHLLSLICFSSYHLPSPSTYTSFLLSSALLFYSSLVYTFTNNPCNSFISCYPIPPSHTFIDPLVSWSSFWCNTWLGKPVVEGPFPVHQAQGGLLQRRDYQRERKHGVPLLNQTSLGNFQVGLYGPGLDNTTTNTIYSAETGLDIEEKKSIKNCTYV